MAMRFPYRNNPFSDLYSFIVTNNLPVKRNLTDFYDLNSSLTPIDKICANYSALPEKEREKPCIVLLGTGSFSPVHIGHLQTMQAAKEYMSQKYNVLGGYLSPGHNEYVSSKNGDSAVDIHDRLALINIALKDSDWLMADPWEGICVPGAVCCTDVIDRTREYLKNKLDIDIQVGHVFGSDSSYFCYSFVRNGIGICVDRPGYSENLQKAKENLNRMSKLFKITPEVHFVEPREDHVVISSTNVRLGNQDTYLKEVSEAYAKILKKNVP